jgi:peroxiredoxin
MAPSIRNGALSPDTGRSGIVTRTDAAGAFSLPPREGRLRILVIHQAGWNELRKVADGAVEQITLKPWCLVSGRLMKGAAPWAGQQVTLEPVLYATSDRSDYSLRTYFRYEVTTDAEGRFAFDRVVDEEVTLARERDDHETVLALKPGDRRADLRIGGIGRPVVAKLIVPPNMKLADARGAEGSLRLVRPVFIKPGNWEELTAPEQAKVRGDFQASAEYRRYADAVRRVALTIAADGSMRAEDVPPGEYVLSVYGLEPTPGDPSHLRMRGSADTSVVMPSAAADGRGDEPLDAGTLELREHNYIAVGSVAPTFEAATFDGKQLKLSDYRGKYVLLDFWATWCGPCVAEMKHLERLHESMKADGRLVIVSVSVDDRIDEPSRFLKERKLPWPQAFAGALSKSSARRQFGVGAIPSIWLIDPEGKIVAKEIFGDQIDEAIGKAMKSKP